MKEGVARTRTLLKLLWVSLRIGMFTFGGGLAMIPLMRRELVEKNGWIDPEDIVDVFALAQSAPGIIAINAFMLAGHRVAGTAGSLVAAFGVVLPSFVVLVFVTIAYEAFITNEYVLGAMRGIGAAVVGLLIAAVVSLRKKSVVDIPGIALFAAAFALAFFVRINAAFIIIGGGLLGFLIGLVRKSIGREGR